MREETENSERNINSENLHEEQNSQLDEWMIRPCRIYKEEYSDCISVKARFNQYFIHGKFIDCSQWKNDLLNCELWDKDKDERAYQQLIESETNRRLERFKPHYANNVWKKRDKPPEDWNSPLPDWMQEKFKNSYLYLKSENMKSGKVDFEDKHCTIL